MTRQELFFTKWRSETQMFIRGFSMVGLSVSFLFVDVSSLTSASTGATDTESTDSDTGMDGSSDSPSKTSTKGGVYTFTFASPQFERMLFILSCWVFGSYTRCFAVNMRNAKYILHNFQKYPLSNGFRFGLEVCTQLYAYSTRLLCVSYACPMRVLCVPLKSSF